MVKPVMIVGGGIAGIQAALDVADQGIQVYLVEKTPSIGGRMAQLDKTFPTLDCSSCILTPKMTAVGRHENIDLLTYSEVQKIEGEAGNFKVKVLKKARYVDIVKCTGCRECIVKCPPKVNDEFNMDLGTRKAIYIPFPQAVPLKATIDTKHCLYFTKPKTPKYPKGVCRICERFCPADAIDFEQKEEEVELDVASIIVATGFSLEDAKKKEMYGYGVLPNVYTSLEFERLVSATGPTGGEIIKRSDGKEPKSIGFIQCVCSRDVTVNPYCSAICCMASTKQAILAKEHLPEVDCTVFYMDLRAFGKGYQEFYEQAEKELGIRFIRSKPAKIEEDPSTKDLIVVYEDTASTAYMKMNVDMAVLAVGLIPNPLESLIPVDEDRFAKLESPYLEPVATPVEGIYVAGLSTGPKDIPDSVTEASAAAMRASIVAGR